MLLSFEDCSTRRIEQDEQFLSLDFFAHKRPQTDSFFHGAKRSEIGKE